MGSIGEVSPDSGQFRLESEFLENLDLSQALLGLSLYGGSLQESEGLCFSEAGNHHWVYSGNRVTMENCDMVTMKICVIQGRVKAKK